MFFKISQNSQACNFIKNKTLAQVFSCEFCEISKKTFLYTTALVAACVVSKELLLLRKNAKAKKRPRKNERKNFNLIKILCDFKGRSDFLAVCLHSDKSGDNRYCNLSNLMFLICQATSHNHLFKWPYDLVVGSPSH